MFALEVVTARYIAAAVFVVMELFYNVSIPDVGIFHAEKFVVAVEVFVVAEIYFLVKLVFAVCQIINVMLPVSVVGKILLVFLCCSSFWNSILSTFL